MAVPDYTELEEDQYASLAFLAFIGCANAADMERVVIGITIVDTEEVLNL